MSRVKREAEHQITKDDRDGSSGEEDVGEGDGWVKASEEVIQTR